MTENKNLSVICTLDDVRFCCMGLRSFTKIEKRRGPRDEP